MSRSSAIKIENLAFLDTTFFADGYWDGPAQQPSDAAIRINYGHNITISSCAFLESLGGYGVAIGNGTKESRVTTSILTRLVRGELLCTATINPPSLLQAGPRRETTHSLGESRCLTMS